MVVWIALTVIVVGILVVIVAIYNKLVDLKFRVKQAWSDVDVQLKRRYDLIPNLVETVKGYASHERKTLEEVINARSKAMQVTEPGEKKGEAENFLSSTLKSLFALAESYPELKANQNFIELQSTLAKLEEDIQLARRYYNAVVRDMNIMTEAFPSNLIASWFGFKKAEYFLLPSEIEREVVKVKF
ncbi:LemA family protein [Candidatus Aerophobetes bacterium]|nr:LemA family protein [Candidatus Aerophobetes bacterium]